MEEGTCCGRMTMTDEQIDALFKKANAEKAKRAETMPTEQDAIEAMWQAHQRLRELGWKDAIYCPKDGSTFDAISPGSTGIHRTHYMGEWPDGSWWAEDGGDLWPSRPCLYRPTEEEKARWAEMGKRLRKLLPTPKGAPDEQ